MPHLYCQYTYIFSICFTLWLNFLVKAFSKLPLHTAWAPLWEGTVFSKWLYGEDKAYLLKLGSLESSILYGSIHNSPIKFPEFLILLKGQLHALALFAIKSPNVKCICKDLCTRAPTLPLHPERFGGLRSHPRLQDWWVPIAICQDDPGVQKSVKEAIEFSQQGHRLTQNSSVLVQKGIFFNTLATERWDFL